jgi:hypothetical protein
VIADGETADGFSDRKDELTPFDKRQALCAETGTRYYGDGGTIHGTPHLTVITDIEGNVLAVEFRCLRLPFQQVIAGLSRAREIRFSHKPNFRINGIEYREKE